MDARAWAGLAAAWALVAWAGAASAARVDAPALPIDRVLTVQPIRVCGGGTVAAPTDCAPATFLPQYLTAANVILNQAGIAVAAAPLRTIVDPRYLNPVNTGAPIDNLRDLVRLPGNGQSGDPNTLNVWLVNTLRDTTSGTARNFYGWGLVGGNGAVIASGADAGGRTAAADTLAHELAHNLGLPHPEDIRAPATQATLTVPRPGAAPATLNMPYNSANNLMRSVGRNVVSAANFCAVPPYTCASGGAPTNSRGVLVTDQIARLRAPPIFRELPNVRSQYGGFGNTGNAPPNQGAYSTTNTSFVGVSPSALAGVSLRWKGATVAAFGLSGPIAVSVPPGGGTPTVVGATATIANAGGNSVVDIALARPINAPFVLSGEWTGVQTGQLDPVTGLPILIQPYSTQYNFGNGITSRAGFDETGLSLAQGGAVFGFDPARSLDPPPAPGFVLPNEVGAISPITGLPVETVIDVAFARPEDLAAFPLPFAGLDPAPPPAVFDPPPPPPALPPLGVAGPGALGLFGLALAGLLAAARRRAAARA